MSDGKCRAELLVDRFNRRRVELIDELRELVRKEPPAAQGRILADWLDAAGVKLPSSGKRGRKSGRKMEIARTWAVTACEPRDRRPSHAEIAEKYDVSTDAADDAIRDYGQAALVERLASKLTETVGQADPKGNPLNWQFVGPPKPEKFGPE